MVMNEEEKSELRRKIVKKLNERCMCTMALMLYDLRLTL